MRNSILILLTALFINCSSDDAKPKDYDEALLGKWKLIEQLADPGDGSGVFMPINSERVLEFFSDGTVTVNGSFCYMANEVEDNSSGTFVFTPDSEFGSSSITPDDCENSKITLRIEGANLVLWYPCIEACGQKFVKI